MDELTEEVRTEFSKNRFGKWLSLGTLWMCIVESFHPLLNNTYEGNYHKNLVLN